jgi:hypothetical protein
MRAIRRRFRLRKLKKERAAKQADARRERELVAYYAKLREAHFAKRWNAIRNSPGSYL